MGPKDTEARLLELQALTCQALADPKRLRILHALAEQELSVGELAEMLEAGLSNVSQHLSVLRGRGLVRSRREGSAVLYSLAYPEIMEACRVLRTLLGKQVAEDSRISDFLSQSRESITRG